MRLGTSFRVGKHGFTLIELMMVVAIMGMLATIIIGSVSGAKASARDIRRVSDIKAIQTALTVYYNDNGHYPCLIYSSSAGVACQPSFVQAQYMLEVPYDPLPASNGAKVQYAYTALNSNNSSNCVSGTNNSYMISYHLGAALENLMPSVTSADKDETVAQEIALNYAACSHGTPSVRFEGEAKTITNGAGSCGGTVIAGEDWCYDVTGDF